MTLFLRFFTLFIYLTLLYELIGIPVPSVASTYQLLFWQDELPASKSLLAKVRRLPLLLKILFLALPSTLVVFIYALPLIQAVVPAFARYLHFLEIAGIWWVHFAGFLLALTGRAVGLFAAWVMHYDKPQSAERFSLQTKGLFSFTRNPILFGMYLTFIGLWLLYPSWEMGIGFLLFAGNMHFRVLLEEDYLSWRFGRPYQTYLAKTRRYL